MNNHRPVWAAIACSVATGFAGCASCLDESAQWRDAVVRQVVSSPADVKGDIDRRCTGNRMESTDSVIAIVRYRVGRAPYDQAIPIDPQLQLSVGDAVTAHPALCRVKRR